MNEICLHCKKGKGEGILGLCTLCSKAFHNDSKEYNKRCAQ